MRHFHLCIHAMLGLLSRRIVRGHGSDAAAQHSQTSLLLVFAGTSLRQLTSTRRMRRGRAAPAAEQPLCCEIKGFSL